MKVKAYVEVIVTNTETGHSSISQEVLEFASVVLLDRFIEDTQKVDKAPGGFVIYRTIKTVV